jgi:hypothetical protein
MKANAIQILVIALVLVCLPIGYIFVTTPPSIYMNDIGDGMIGDKILVSGNANRLDNHEVKVVLTEAGNDVLSCSKIAYSFNKEFGDWCKFTAIQCNGKRYLTRIAVDHVKKELGGDKACEVLYVYDDFDLDMTINEGDEIELKDGYKLRISKLYETHKWAHTTYDFQIDLIKNGKVVKTLSIDDSNDDITFVYTKDIGDIKEVPIIAVRVCLRLWTGIVGGVQISENPTFIYDAKKTKIENGIFSTTFYTSSLDGSEYEITAICENISDSKTFHLFSSLVEKISSEKSVYIKGSPIKVIVSLKNPHKEERKINLNLQLDNKVVKTKSVSIPPEGFKNINFTLDDVDVGKHKMSAGGYEASFEVKPVPSIRLNPIEHGVGIGNPLTISGTSNLPDNTKIEITIKDGVILAQKTTNIINGRFSIEIDTSNAKEGIYTVIAEEPVRKLSDSTEVKFYEQYWDIKIIDLSVSPSTVIVGDKVTVDVTLKNTGNIVGTRDVIPNIDGKAVQSKTVTMYPNKMEKVSFDINTTQSDVGRHTVCVEDKTAVLTVKPTPKINLDEIGDVKIGDELTISGSTNLKDGTELLIVIESDTYHFEPQVTTAKDGRFTEKLDTTDVIEGIYKITAKDAKAIHGTKDIGSVFLFSTKPRISISLSVSSREILVGQTAKVFVRVTNSGDKKEEITLSLKIDGMPKDTQTITVEANDFNTATFEIHNSDIGEHIIDVNGYKTMFSVIAPTPVLPHISTDRLSIDLYSTKTVVSKSENIIVTLSAVNKITNDRDLHLQLILTIPSGISATSTAGAFSIAGGQATFDKVLKTGETISGITLNLVPNEVGSYTIKGDVLYQVGDEKLDEVVYLPIFVGS